MKKGLGLLAGAMLLLAGCAPGGGNGASGNTEKNGDTIKIGVNMELSGAVSAYGTAEKTGIDLAVKEINEDGGILGKQVQIVEKDNKSETSESFSVAQSLTNNDDVVAIIGPATSGAAKAATPAVTSAKVPMITPSGTDDSLTVNNGAVQEFVFRSCYQDSYQGTTLGTYAQDTLESKKAVILGDKSSDYGKGLTKAFKDTYKGDIVAEEYFVGKDTDFQAVLTKIKNLDFDVLFIPGYYTEAGLIVKQAREMGITQPVLGADGFGNPAFVSTAGAENATDVYYTTHYSEQAGQSEKAKAFVESYQAEYGEKPSTFAALAYDAVYMVKAGLEEADAVDTQKLTDALAGLTDFEGVTGTMTIDENHNPEKSIVIVKLENGENASEEVIDPE